MSESCNFQIILSAINDVTQRGLTFPWSEVHGSKQSWSCCAPSLSKEFSAPWLLPRPTLLAVITALSLLSLWFKCGTGRIWHQPTQVWLGWALSEHCPMLACSLASAWRKPRQVPRALQVCCSQGSTWDSRQIRAVAHMVSAGFFLRALCSSAG